MKMATSLMDIAVTSTTSTWINSPPTVDDRVGRGQRVILLYLRTLARRGWFNPLWLADKVRVHYLEWKWLTIFAATPRLCAARFLEEGSVIADADIIERAPKDHPDQHGLNGGMTTRLRSFLVGKRLLYHLEQNEPFTGGWIDPGGSE